MKLTMPVVLSFAFAVYWLVIGFVDYFFITYNTKRSARFHQALPLILCLCTSLDLALLGYFEMVNKRLLVFLALAIFAILWLSWHDVIQESHKETRIDD